MTILTSAPDVILFVTDSDVTLWLPNSPDPVLQIASTDDRLGAQLAEALLRLKVSRAQIILDITDIHLQVETLPRAGVFDQAKVAARRSHFLYPTAELRKALRLDDTPGSSMLNYLFVAVPNHAQIAAIYNSLAKAHVWLQNVLLFPVEFWGFHWNVARTDERQRDFVLLNLETHTRLLAIENDSLLLSRTLAPAVADRPELLRQEIQTTQSYLLRKGWNKDTPWCLSAFGLRLPPNFAPEIGGKWRFNEPASDARTLMIEKLFAGKAPLCPLVSTRMRQRQWLLRTNRIIHRAMQVAAAAVLLLVGFNTAQLWHTESAATAMHVQLATLPGYDKAAGQKWKRLQFWRDNGAKPLPLAAAVAKALPNAAFLRSLSWNSPPPEQGMDKYTMSLVIGGLRTDELTHTITALSESTHAAAKEEHADNRQQTGELGAPSSSNTAQTDYVVKIEPLGVTP